MRKPWYDFLYVRSPIAKIGLATLGILITLAIVLFQGVIEVPRMEAQTASWDGRGIEIGAELYGGNCASCHGLEGMGLPPNVAPSLNSRYFFTQRLEDVGWAGTMDQYIGLTLHAGRPSKTNTQWVNVMPTWGSEFGGPLRSDQIEHIVLFLLNWEESALEQTPEEDPWIFYQEALAKQLPYSPDEPGYEQKLARAIAAAEAAGAANYSIGGVEAQPPSEDEAVSEGPRAPEEIFNALGCVGCHNLDEEQTDSNQGPVGPHMGNLAENAATRVDGQDSATYVYNSIAHPNDYIVPGYNANIMPANLADQMTEEELNGLVEWLLEQ